MKKLILSLPLALLAGFALMSPGAGATEEARRLESCEQLVSSATAPELMCGKCGDRYCSASCGETALNCPKDCGVPSEY
jgi:hypothetical protein